MFTPEKVAATIVAANEPLRLHVVDEGDDLNEIPHGFQPKGRLLIGFRNDRYAWPGRQIDEDEAHTLLNMDIASVSARLDSVLSRKQIRLTMNRKAALIALAFFIGVHSVATSALVKFLVVDDIQSASEAFEKLTVIDGRKPEPRKTQVMACKELFDTPSM